MDNALFVPSVARLEWLHELLPWLSQAELPVAGRRFVDYGLENAKKFGYGAVGIIDWHFSKRLFADCSALMARGLPVFYHPGKGDLPRGLDDLKRIVSPFTNPLADGLAVVWGLCLTNHKVEETAYEEISPEECEDTPTGVYVRRNGGWSRMLPRAVAVSDVRSWQRLSLMVLENPSLFTLPGYSAEEGVHLGRNVVLERGARLRPPVIMQDNTWCSRNVRLDGDVIVGQRSFIGEGARLKRTIVGDDTYVGMGLDLEDKIVVGHRVIDAENGHWTDVEEPGVAQYLGRGGISWLHRLWRFLRGTSYGRSR